MVVDSVDIYDCKCMRLQRRSFYRLIYSSRGLREYAQIYAQAVLWCLPFRGERGNQRVTLLCESCHCNLSVVCASLESEYPKVFAPNMLQKVHEILV